MAELRGAPTDEIFASEIGFDIRNESRLRVQPILILFNHLYLFFLFFERERISIGGWTTDVDSIRRWATREGLISLVVYFWFSDHCRRRESNSHALRRNLLRVVCLPFHHFDEH